MWNNELKIISDEKVTGYFEALSLSILHGGAELKHVNPQSRQTVLSSTQNESATQSLRQPHNQIVVYR
jgi:hypothetical protein